jgi:hypothetical protein
MRLVATLTSILFALPFLNGCQTSCGHRGNAVLWSDGIVSERNGARIYETTAVRDTWLHFPSYRRFRLPHGFGTKDVSIETYISLAEDAPAADSDEPTKFAVASSGDVLVSIEDDNHVVVENETCENDFYLFVRITDQSSH